MTDVAVFTTTNEVVVSSGSGGVILADTQRDIAVGTAVHLGGDGLGANVGGGDAEVFKNKTAATLNFRTISGINGISVAENGDVIEIDGSAVTDVPAGSSGSIQFNNAGSFGGADLFWDAGNDMLGFGGLTSAYPGLTWSAISPILQLRVADDSDWASMTALDFTLSAGGSLATHATRHQNGGADEISVAGLSGLLADPQTPDTHASSHAGAGGDPITSLGAFTMTGTLDLDGQQLSIDSDGDSYWSHSVDDAPSLYLSGSEAYKFEVDSFTIRTTQGATGPFLYLGGNTSTDILLKRVSNTFLYLRTGDDAAYASLVGANLTAFSGYVTCAASSYLGVFGKSRLASSTNGNFTISNAAQDDFNLLAFGQETASYPAWKRNGNAFHARLADDSDYTSVVMDDCIPDGYLRWLSKSRISCPSDGVLRLTNNALNDYSLLQFGGGTSAYPAVKRSGVGLAVRTADDTANASFTCGAFNAQLFTLLYGATYGAIAAGGDDGVKFCVRDAEGIANNNLIITAYSNIAYDHDHDTLSPNPTVFIHSQTNPNTDNTQWLSLTHNQTDGVIASGKGALSLRAASSNIVLSNTAGNDFGLLDFGGTTSSYPAVKKSISAPGPGLELRLADDSDYSYLTAYHLGLNRDPTATHILIGAEPFTGTGNVIGYGCFPEYAPTSLATNIISSIQGNTWFSTSNWAAGSRVQCLDFYPAPLIAGTTFGSASLDIAAINTAGLLNILGRTITANTVTGIALTPVTNIFAGTDNTTANIVRGIYVYSAAATTGTWGRLVGLEIEPQTSGVINQGLAMSGDGIGCDIVFGAGFDANMFYDGSNLIIDPDLVGSGRVLIGTTGDDDMLLNSIEIDGNLNHDGANAGFRGATPIAAPGTWAITNHTSDRTMDCNATTVNELADIVGQIVQDLLSQGLLAGTVT